MTENKEWSYFSSFVVEVKYSPFYNIHNDEGKTRAMKQMSDYWSIMYVRLSNGEKKFNRNRINNVVCIYPGAYNQPIKISHDFGTFLQFYPNTESDDIYDIIGKEELKSLIVNWIQS